MFNKDLADKLRQLANYADNEWAAKYYNAAADKIISVNLSMMSTSEIDEYVYVNFGSGTIAEYILEYTMTGQITYLLEIMKYNTFIKIYGVGAKTSRKYVESGINNIEELKAAVATKKIKMTHAQKLGLLYYDDLNSRIPRQEVEDISKIIETYMRDIDKQIIFNVAGSYRRGSKDSGDIDIIVSSKRADIIDKIRHNISHNSIYIDTLGAGKSRLTILVKIYDLVRHVDILLIDLDNYYAALVYFTGSAEFNIAMRAHAKKMDMLLNQNGLLKNGRNIPITSERHLFELLKLKYVEPQFRRDYNDIKIK